MARCSWLSRDSRIICMTQKEKDSFVFPSLPDSFSLKFKRDTDGKVVGIALTQPQGNFDLKKSAGFASDITVDQLLTKVINAAGGEANIRKHKSMIINGSIDFENQGVTGEIQVMNKAPNLTAGHAKFIALGKEIATTYHYFDGANGESSTSFSPVEKLVGKQLDAAKTESDFYGVLDWKSLFKSIEIRGKSKVGNEDAYIVLATPEKGDPVTYYVSSKSFLLLKTESFEYISSADISLPVTSLLEGYREVNGQMIAFKKTEQSASSGSVVVRIKDVKFDADIPNSEFHLKSK